MRRPGRLTPGAGDCHAAMQSHRLFLSDSFRESWSAIIRPWLLDVGSVAWRNALPTVVLTPTRGHAKALRHLWMQAVDANPRGRDSAVGLLGVRFWTPSDARAFLSQRFAQKQLPATRENMHLLLSAAAGEQMRRRTAENPDARPGSLLSVATDSSVLARALDDLGAAGWSWQDQGPEWTRPLLAIYAEQLELCGLTSLQLHDRLLFDAALAHARRVGPSIGPVLIHGFGAEYWPRYQTLRSVAVASTSTILVLPYPSHYAEEAAQTWISTWETWLNVEREFIEAEADAPSEGSAGNAGSSDGRTAFQRDLHAIHDAVELHSGGTPSQAPAPVASESVRFLLSKGVAEEARAAAMQAIQWLEAGTGEGAAGGGQSAGMLRIGIVVPGLGAMAREISALLSAWQVPHFDSIGHHTPGLFSSSAWEAWLDLQLRPCRRTLLRFLRVWKGTEDLAVAGPSGGETTVGALSLGMIEDVISGALAELFIDDILLIREALKSSARPRDAAVGKLLDRIALLPEAGGFDDFLSTLEAALPLLGWQAELDVIRRQAAFLRGRMSLKLHRQIFLNWLGEVTQGVGRTRDDLGRHFYARVHLVTYEEAAGQPWTHLILTSLADGVWPAPPEESAFLSDEDIRELNKRLRNWNLASLRSTSVGTGEYVPTLGRAWCLSPDERRQLAEARLLHLVTAATHGLALSTRLGDETEPARELNAGAFFTRIYGAARGQWLDEAAAHRLEVATRELLDQAPSTLEAPARRASDPSTAPAAARLPQAGQTRVARLARLKDTEGLAAPRFSEYEFALPHRPARPISLPCREWELALKAPAMVWMKRLLGVGPDRAEDDDITSRSTGQWVHQWLARAPIAAGRAARSGGAGRGLGGPRLHPMPGVDEWRATIRQCANMSLRSVAMIAARHGRALPPLWVPVWNRAAWLAVTLSEIVADSGYPELVSEISLTPPGAGRGGFVSVPTSSGIELLLEGRMDVLLHKPFADAELPKASVEPGPWDEPSPLPSAPSVPAAEPWSDEESPFLSEAAEAHSSQAQEVTEPDAVTEGSPAEASGVEAEDEEDDLFTRATVRAHSREPDGLDYGDGRWLILDYKTGRSTRNLTMASLAKGTGLQVALYALALRQLGAPQVDFAYAYPSSTLGEAAPPPLSVRDLAEIGPLLDSLARMQNSGVFGWHGQLRTEFGPRLPYPLATLPVPEDLLEERWLASHPALAGALA
ncbi:hypothetical protein DB346_12730 [Verrucomicrobia bacterium LW23]|nr:hypothetical protein DB346_12730 [Verrucomicrobia bacterium LW23]